MLGGQLKQLAEGEETRQIEKTPLHKLPHHAHQVPLGTLIGPHRRPERQRRTWTTILSTHKC